MTNPWLGIPLADYEGHMRAPEVGQLDALADLFESVLRTRKPRSVAIAGIAGGNGLDRIDPAVTRQVTGIDINQAYLAEVDRKYGDSFPCLQLVCADLSLQDAPVPALPEVELVHGALILEHAGVTCCLDHLVSMVSATGAIALVLQLPSTGNAPSVGASPFVSVGALQSHFSFADKAWLQSEMQRRGFHAVEHTERSLPAGKGFWMGVFERGS